jgi:hypothetical protein
MYQKLVPLALPFVAGAIFALVGYGGWMLYTNTIGNDAKTDFVSTHSYQERQAYWEETIRTQGAKAAYLDLAEKITGLSITKQHVEGHIFGKALYVIEGFDGVKICDSAFMYACFHSFMTQAIQNEGTGAAQKLHEACIEALGTRAEECEHGVGHGIQTMFTYDLDGINKALAVCKSMTPGDLLDACVGGVYMEYSRRDMGNEGTDNQRPFAIEEVLEPCASLSDEDKAACAMWQSRWWMGTDPDRVDPKKMADKMGAWCKAMPGGSRVYALCIEGVTRRIKSLARGSPVNVADLCERLTEDDETKFHCQRLSAQRLVFFYPYEKAVKACRGLPEEQRAACTESTRVEDERLIAINGKYDEVPDIESTEDSL